MTFAETWTQRLRELLPVDLPESRSLNLLSSQDCPDGFGDFARMDCGAYTSPSLSRQLERHLRERDAWRGDGFVIVFDERTMNSVGDGEQLGLLIHEVSHCCCDADQIPLFRRPIWTEEIIESARPADDIAERINRDAVPWEQHGTQFVRAALHLFHRAQAAGARIDLECLPVAGRSYGLSSIEAYSVALCDEVRERIDEPVETILQSPEPELMRELFAGDVYRFHAAQFRHEVARQMEAGKTPREALRLMAAKQF